MNIEWVARDVVVTVEVQDRVTKKLEKILERSPKETPVRVMVSNTRNLFNAHLSMNVTGKEIVAQADNEHLVAALDDALDKAERQFNKHKDKLTRKR